MTQMIPVSNDLYVKLQRSARQHGLDNVSDYLELLIEQDTETVSESNILPENQSWYDEVMALSKELSEKYPHLADIDVVEWIREDRER